MQKATFHVPGITCAGCISSMKFALGRRPGVLKLDGDAKSKSVTIQYDESKTSIEQLKDALDQIGFAPEN